MQTVSTIGLDIAKSVFQVHGVDANGLVVVRRQLKCRYVLAFFREAGAVPGRHRGLCLVTLLVAPATGTRPQRAAHAAGVREALRKETEKRYGRR